MSAVVKSPTMVEVYAIIPFIRVRINQQPKFIERILHCTDNGREDVKYKVELNYT